MKSEHHDAHEWKALVVTPTDEIHTCLRCGLIYLKTISNVFYLTQIGGNALRCGRAFREQNAPAPPVPFEDSVESLDVNVRAYNCLRIGFELKAREEDAPGRRLVEIHFREVLNLNPRHIKNFGKLSFAEVCNVLYRRGVAEEELRRSEWWSKAREWQSYWPNARTPSRTGAT